MEEYYKHINSENQKHQSVIKEKKETYRNTYYTQLLFVSGTLAGILIALAPDQKDLSLVGIGSILLAQIGLLGNCVLLLTSLNLQLLAFHKFGNKVTSHFQKKLSDPTYDERQISQSPPYMLSVIEFLVSSLFIISMLSLMVFCISVAWPRLGPYFDL
jgi:hypothetical protein